MTSYLPDLEANMSRCTGQQNLKDYLFYKKSYGHLSAFGVDESEWIHFLTDSIL